MKIRDFIRKNKFKIVLLFSVLCVSLAFMVFIRTEADYFWHLAAGKYMINNHTILTHDVFSWYLKGTYWMSHEWLFEIIIYGLSLIFGKYSLLIYCFSCFFGLLLIMYFANRKYFAKNKLFTFIWLACILIFAGFITGRPHMLSFIFIAITMYLLRDAYNNKSNKIYWLPVLTIFWANIHGGTSLLSYLLCFIFMFCSMVSFDAGKLECRKKPKKLIIKYLIVGLLCMLAINIGPHSYSMFLYPYANINDSLMTSVITEWQCSNIGDRTHLPYFVFCFIIMIVFLLSDKKIRFLDFVLFLFALFLGLKSIRFWPYTYIIMSFVIFYYIPYRKDDPGTNTVYLILSCGCLALFILGFNFIFRDSLSHEIKDEAIKVLKREKPKRLYNLYDYGGELIYNDIPVFIDGRADLYSKHNLEDAVNISLLKGNYEKIIKKYDFDYFMVNKNFSIYRYLESNDNYKQIYHDKKTIIYKKIRD